MHFLFSTVMLQTKVWSVLTSNKPLFFFPFSDSSVPLLFIYGTAWSRLLRGGEEGMLRQRVNLMWKCRLSRIYPFEKKDLFTCFVGLSPKPHLTPLPKSFWHLHLVHSGQALFALLEKVVGARPSPLRGTSVGLCHGKRGISLSSCPLPFHITTIWSLSASE